MHKLLVLALVASCGGALPAPPPPPPPAPASAAAPIPRALLFGYPERDNVQLSPDGSMLSWIAEHGGTQNVFVAPVGALHQARVVTAETARPIRSYFWAYTSHHLVYRQDAGGNEDTHFYRVELATGQITDLTPYPRANARLEMMDPRSPTKLLVRLNDRDPRAHDVYALDLLTGERTLVVKNDHGFVAFASDNDLEVRLAAKKLADGTLQLLVPDGAAWRPFQTVPFEDAETTRTLHFAPGNRQVYLRDTRERDTAALIALDLATGQRQVLAEDPRADVLDVLSHPTTGAVQAVAFEYDRVRWRALDPEIAPDLAALAKLDGGEASVVSRATDDRTWLVLSRSEQHPRRYYLWDRPTRRARFLFSGHPELDRQPLRKMWPVEIQSRDGLTMVSYLTLPAAADPDGDGKSDAPVPLVLLVHGGPWARDSWGPIPQHQHLANRGYAVLAVNYRGSTGFGKRFQNAASLQWGRKMHDDLIDAVDWAVRTGITRKDQVCILGASYGGYAALAGLTLTPDVFRCAIDVVGPSNLLTLQASLPPHWSPLVATMRTRIGDPTTPEGRALLTAASPLTHVGNIKRPLLIGHGANDPRVKQAESEQIVAAMKQRGLPVTYVLFPDEGHGFRREENRTAFWAVAEAFLARHLGGTYQPITQAELAASTMQIREGRDGIPGL